MYATAWYQWLLFFYLYSFFGWIFESCYVSIRQKHWVNRGFLRIPMLPLYGSGAVMMLWVSRPFLDSLILTWFSGVIGATVLEYVTGYFMELLFKVRYWDYSDQKFNVNGYICLSSSIAWGFLTIFMTHVIHRPIAELISIADRRLELVLAAAITVIFVYDAVVSVREALAFGKALTALQKIRQSIDEIPVQVQLLRMETDDRLKQAKADILAKAGQRLPAELLAKAELPNPADLLAKAELLAKAGRQLPADLLEKQEHQLAQLKELLRQRETSLSGLFSRHRRYIKGMFRSNPTVSSKRFQREFDAIRKYFEDGGDGSL